MNPARPFVFIFLVGVVVSNNLRSTGDENKLSFLETFLMDIGTTEEPTSTLGWSTVGTDEPTTLYTTVTTTPGNDITTGDPNALVVNATVNSSTVTGSIPASEDVMNMCNCASANITTLMECDPPLASCAQG